MFQVFKKYDGEFLFEIIFERNSERIKLKVRVKFDGFIRM